MSLKKITQFSVDIPISLGTRTKNLKSTWSSWSWN